MSRRQLSNACRMALMVTLVGVVPVGCRSLTQIAPPADDQLVTASGADLPTLERGRMIYLTQCTACHVAEPVRDYSAKQWAKILPVMNKESKLNAAQASDLKAYIDACLALPEATQ